MTDPPHIDGVAEAMQAFTKFKKNVQKKHIRRGVTKAGRQVAKIAKQGTARETGALKTSQGQKVKTYPSGVVIAIIGPRKGFQRAVVVKVSKRGKRSLKALKRGVKGRKIRNPIYYAHLIEGGTIWALAQPYLKPAGQRGKQILQTEVNQSIQDAVKEAGQ